RRGKARTAAENEEDAMVGQPGDEMLEKLLRARIDPVQVLDDHDDRPVEARAEEHVAQRAKRSRLQLGPREAIEERGRRRPAEEMREEGRGLFPGEAKRIEPIAHELVELRGTHPVPPAEVPADQIEDRAEWNGAAVRDPGAFQLEDVPSFEL